jgi:acetylornithine/N-succinyldiaminopimelate aminotransferase
LSFHGRTISTASATGQSKHRDKYKPLMPNYRFVPFGDIPAMKQNINREVAAVILEPIQGEGGVRVPPEGYFREVSSLCRASGSLLIADEIQTGFCRTGPMFAIDPLGVEVDFLTLAKGIAGGFPFGAFAVSETVASRFEKGDHGGTYCGNPLGCAVAHAVIQDLIQNNISGNVRELGSLALGAMRSWQNKAPGLVKEVRGKGLLMAIEFHDEATATRIADTCLKQGLFVRQTQGTAIRVFPALNITAEEIQEGLRILEKAVFAARL